jgi:carboxylesterase type B
MKDFLGKNFNYEKYFRTETEGEDCLFLDVARPIEIDEGEKLPVLVWIYGGGYVYGAKDMPVYTPAGFYRRAAGRKFLYVALNYRVSLRTL